MNLFEFTSGIQLAVRAAVAASVSFALAQFFNFQHPLFAVIAAVVATDFDAVKSRELGLLRLVATVIGASCGAILSGWLAPGPWSVGLSILVAMFICQLLRARDGAKVAGYICGIVVIDHSSEPWSYAFFRSLETALGISVAWAIAYVPRLVRLNEPGEKGS